MNATNENGLTISGRDTIISTEKKLEKKLWITIDSKLEQAAGGILEKMENAGLSKRLPDGSFQLTRAGIAWRDELLPKMLTLALNSISEKSKGD